MSTRPYVVGLDFGTAYSGIAFANRFRPSEIACEVWPGSSNLKTRTDVLVDSDMSLVAFGDAAFQTYVESKQGEMDTVPQPIKSKSMSLDQSSTSASASLGLGAMLAAEEKDDQKRENKALHFFKKFKMSLYNLKSGRHHKAPRIRDAKRKKFRARKIFAVAIRYLKKTAMERLEETTKKKITDDDVLFVLTIPAVWNNAGKQVMRRAARRAGLKRDGFTFALEPEAASIYCLDHERTVNKKGIPAGSSFVVVDCGGGTTDITIHLTVNDTTVRNKCQPTGGPWGSTYVDDEFEAFLARIVGKGTLTSYQKHHEMDFHELMETFALRKQDTKPEEDKERRIKLPPTFSKFVLTHGTTGLSFKHLLAHSSHAKDASIAPNGDLKITHALMMSFFAPVVGAIIAKLKQMPELDDCKTMFVVGGFARSQVLFDELKQNFGGKMDVLRTPNPMLAVLRGAVLYGINQDSIASRVSAKTYGYVACRPWSAEYALTGGIKIVKRQHGKLRECCNNVFESIIKRGTEVPREHLLEHIVRPSFDGQTAMTIAIYSSEVHDPLVVPRANADDDEEEEEKEAGDAICKHEGTVTVPLPILGADMNRNVKLSFSFGGAEIRVQVLDETSQQMRECSITFLGNQALGANENDSGSGSDSGSDDDDDEKDTSDSDSDNDIEASAGTQSAESKRAAETKVEAQIQAQSQAQTQALTQKSKPLTDLTGSSGLFSSAACCWSAAAAAGGDTNTDTDTDFDGAQEHKDARYDREEKKNRENEHDHDRDSKNDDKSDDKNADKSDKSDDKDAVEELESAASSSSSVDLDVESASPPALTQVSAAAQAHTPQEAEEQQHTNAFDALDSQAALTENSSDFALPDQAQSNLSEMAEAAYTSTSASTSTAAPATSSSSVSVVAESLLPDSAAETAAEISAATASATPTSTHEASSASSASLTDATTTRAAESVKAFIHELEQHLAEQPEQQPADVEPESDVRLEVASAAPPTVESAVVEPTVAPSSVESEIEVESKVEPHAEAKGQNEQPSEPEPQAEAEHTAPEVEAQEVAAPAVSLQVDVEAEPEIEAEIEIETEEALHESSDDHDRADTDKLLELEHSDDSEHSQEANSAEEQKVTERVVEPEQQEPAEAAAALTVTVSPPESSTPVDRVSPAAVVRLQSDIKMPHGDDEHEQNSHEITEHEVTAHQSQQQQERQRLVAGSAPDSSSDDFVIIEREDD